MTSNLQLDGGNTIIGTEFIKLLATGSSNLATEDYVNTAVANGGGNGGTGTTDLTNYYNKSQVDNLIVNKLDKDNPQDITGTLRLGHVSGNSKIILNAVSSTKDFYVSGDAEVNGSFLATSIDSNSFVQCANVIASDDVKTNVIDSNGISDVTFKRNSFDICYFKNSSLELNTGIDLVAPAQVQANTYNSFDDSSVLFFKNGAEFIRFRKTEDDILVSKDIEGTNLKVSGSIATNAISSNGDNNIVFKRNDVNKVSLTNNDFITENNVNLVSQGQVKCDIYNSYGDDNVSFKRYGTEYFVLNSNPAPIVIPCVEVASGIGFTTDKFFCDEFRSKNDNVNIAYWGGNSTATGKVNYMTYKRLNEEVNFYRDVNITSGSKLISDTVSSPDNTDLTIERGGSNYITLKDGLIEVKGGVDIVCNKDVRTNTLNTVDDTDLKFARNDVQVFRLENVTEPMLVQPWGASLMTPKLRTNIITARSLDSDTSFIGGDNTGLAETTYLKFNRTDETIESLKHIVVNAGKQVKANIYNSSDDNDVYLRRNNVDYIQLGGTYLRTILLTGCQSDIYDSLGNSDVSYRRNGIDFFYLRDGQVELNTGITLVGDVNDTSDKTKKYDIKSIDNNFTDIVKSIEPKTFKMIDEKEKGINKNHIGFVADDLLNVIPKDWENIISENNEGIKQLNYVKLSSVNWRATRELILENEKMKKQIEHLESSVYELQEALKELIKPKPKSKAKAKSKN